MPDDTLPPVLEVTDLVVAYRLGLRRWVRAVAGVSLEIKAGRTLALIGESGSGKSSLARAVCGLGPVESGTVRVGGVDLTAASDRAAAAGRSGVQIVFQDPTTALDPRWSIWRSVAEPRLAGNPGTRAQERERAVALLERVGLPAGVADRRPSEVSGGQRQRVTIARALSSEPKLIVLDEAVSALDVSVRNEVLFLLDGLQRESGLTYLLITHDMGAVVQAATDVAVLYLGRLVESGGAMDVLANPAHPYTRALLAAVPTLRGGNIAATDRPRGEIGNPEHPPPGCRFHPRCPFATAVCGSDVPELRPVLNRDVACHHAEEVLARNPGRTLAPSPLLGVHA
jgi:oligopeptide/dipeptide ABC transporter ATP-binding protein